MSDVIPGRQRLFGLLELDPEGTVLYSRLEGDYSSTSANSDLAGRNFFSEVAPFKNVEEFRRCLDSFNGGREDANSFEFNCEYEDGAVSVKVLLARIRDQLDDYRTKSLLVHLKALPLDNAAAGKGISSWRARTEELGR